MIEENLQNIYKELPSGIKLVAVSKFHGIDEMMQAYQAGQRLFGENRPQELAVKAPQLPQDARIHFLGHLQTNKLKMVLPYVSMVESVDSLHLLDEINAWGRKNGKVTDVLLELHIASEETKQGFVEEETLSILFNHEKYGNVRFCGLMGMATNTDDMDTVDADFHRISSYFEYLKDLFPELESFTELSIGMSSDWRIAIKNGATIVRIGSAIFGPRDYQK